MDHIVHVPHIVKQGETILAKDDLRFVPGGKGANQAYAIGKLGGDVIEYAQKLASIVVSRSGALSSIPIAEEVEELG